MWIKRLGLIGFAVAAGLGAAACNQGYGYGGVDLGYGGYHDPYVAGPYGYSAGSGWYGDFYYPGTGVYVFDRSRRPHRWTDAQRRHWLARRAEGSRPGSASGRPGRTFPRGLTVRPDRPAIAPPGETVAPSQPLVRRPRALDGGRQAYRQRRAEGGTNPVLTRPTVRPDRASPRIDRPRNGPGGERIGRWNRPGTPPSPRAE